MATARRITTKVEKRLPRTLDFALVQALRVEAAKAELDRANKNNAEPMIVAELAAKLARAAKALPLAEKPKKKKRRK
jgi:hypothetical protein